MEILALNQTLAYYLYLFQNEKFYLEYDHELIRKITITKSVPAKQLPPPLELNF